MRQPRPSDGGDVQLSSQIDILSPARGHGCSLVVALHVNLDLIGPCPQRPFGGKCAPSFIGAEHGIFERGEILHAIRKMHSEVLFLG